MDKGYGTNNDTSKDDQEEHQNAVRELGQTEAEDRKQTEEDLKQLEYDEMVKNADIKTVVGKFFGLNGTSNDVPKEKKPKWNNSELRQ